MERFMTRHEGRIVGMLSGFDRLVFRGTLRSISFLKGMDQFLSSQRVLYKDFGAFATRITARVRAHAEALSQQTGRPLEYLASPTIAKDVRARAIAARDGITEGLICIFSCVEPCWSVTVRGDRATKRLRLVQGERRCAHLYFYVLDPEIGLLHVRLQSWLPLSLQVWVNGRHWLAHRLDAAAIAYTQSDNAFTTIADLDAAQRLSDGCAAWSWQRRLDELAAWVNPWLTGEEALFRGYYWSVRESEYATDVLFTRGADLAALYPRLVHHALETFGPSDILRFLGRHVPGRFVGEARTTLVHRPEGCRVRHWIDENSLKMYDKGATILRIEFTLNNPDRFKVYRRRPSDGQYEWLPLRRGLADLGRRASLGRAATLRYLDALSVVGEPTPSHHLLDRVSHRVIREGRPYRALRPISPDEAPLLQVILRGEFVPHGFTNRDIRRHLPLPPEVAALSPRQQSARVTRALGLLRAHRLIKKVPGTHRYRLTRPGTAILTTAIRFRETDIALLAA
jgi:hypothetical protein